MRTTTGSSAAVQGINLGESNSAIQSLERAQAQWKNLFSRPSTEVAVDDSTTQGRQPSLLTRRNQRENHPWGDVLTSKAANCTRVYVQNVNGLSLDRRGGQLNDVCKVIQEVQGDVFCGQEHNLDVTQMHIRSILYDTVKKYWQRTKFIAGTTPIPFRTPYKPGGTFLLTIGSFSGHIIRQSQDRWGRWVIQEFVGRLGTKLIIV